MKKRVVVHYLDSSKKWGRRVLNSKADGEPLVLLLRDQRYRAVRPIGKGFPAEWCRNVGGPAPGKARGAGREIASASVSCLKSPYRKSDLSQVLPGKSGVSQVSSRNSATSQVLPRQSAVSSSTGNIAKASVSSKLTSENVRKLSSTDARATASSRAASLSTFKVGAQSSGRASCSTFRVATPVTSKRGSKVSTQAGPRATKEPASSSTGPKPQDTESSCPGQVDWDKGAFTCVCGWQLPAWKELIPRKEQNSRFYAARQHWAKCQPGFPFPKLSPKQRDQKSHFLASKASEGRKRKAWMQWCNLRTIVSDKLLANLHELKDTPVREPPKRTPTKFECIRCGGCYDLSHSRRMACPATPDHLKMRGRLVELAVRKVEGCRTKRAVKLTSRKDPRKSSRKPMKGMSAKRRRAADKQTLTRHVQVSK